MGALAHPAAQSAGQAATRLPRARHAERVDTAGGCSPAMKVRHLLYAALVVVTYQDLVPPLLKQSLAVQMCISQGQAGADREHRGTTYKTAKGACVAHKLEQWR